jgi:hypothetical protein
MMQNLTLRLRGITSGKCALAGAILLLSLLTLQSQKASAWQVNGRELNWSVSVPDGWMGGSFYQIETSIQNTDNVQLRDILRTLQDSAKDNEAVLIHLEDAFDAAHRHPSFSTRTMTEIKVTFGKNAPGLKEMSEAFGAYLRAKYQNGRVTLTSQGPFQIPQMTAYAWSFEVRPVEGGMLHYDVVVVSVAAGEQLGFTLVADSSRYTARAATFRRILGSLRVR